MQSEKSTKKSRRGISSSTLKIIAIITMLIDHIGASVLYRYMVVNHVYADYLLIYQIMRVIGRISFPIFIFLLVEGLYHTRNVWKYLLRLLIFCFVSEIPFDLAFFYKPFNWDYQNVFFTLLIGLFAIALFRILEENKSDNKWLNNIFILRTLEVVIALAAMALAHFLKTDYGWAGVLAIITAYILKRFPRLQMPGVCIILTICAGASEVYALFGIPLYIFYDGRRGNLPKWIPYIFYPAHLLILWGITVYFF